MKFKFPGWGIGWFTPILAVCGPLLGYWEYMNRGELYIFFALLWTTLGIFSLLTWFQQRWVAFPMIGYFSFAMLAVLISVVKNGATVPNIGKIIYLLTAIYELWAWRRSTAPPSDDHGSSDLQLADRGENLN